MAEMKMAAPAVFIVGGGLPGHEHLVQNQGAAFDVACAPSDRSRRRLPSLQAGSPRRRRPQPDTTRAHHVMVHRTHRDRAAWWAALSAEAEARVAAPDWPPGR